MIPRSTKPSRAHQARYRRGCAAEDAACVWLEQHHYTIDARRMRTPYGEIDIVARSLGTLAFIEVKARNSVEEALYALSTRQRQRIIHAALHYLSEHPHTGDIRFDVLAITPDGVITHLQHAWEAEGMI